MLVQGALLTFLSVHCAPGAVLSNFTNSKSLSVHSNPVTYVLIVSPERETEARVTEVETGRARFEAI